MEKIWEKFWELSSISREMDFIFWLLMISLYKQYLPEYKEQTNLQNLLTLSHIITGNRKQLFLIRYRLHCFRMSYIWDQKLKLLLCLKAKVQKQHVAAEISLDHSIKGTKNFPVGRLQPAVLWLVEHAERQIDLFD